MRGGVNILGSFSAAIGTTVAAKATIEALKLQEIPLCVWSRPGGVPGREPEALTGVPAVESIDDLPYDTTLILDTVAVLPEIGALARRVRPRSRIGGVVYWEIEHFPLAWRAGFSVFDTLYAPTEFVRHAIETSLQRPAALCPVVPYYPWQPVSRVALPEAFTFFLHFDLMSTAERKNPAGAIQAFLKAFGSRMDVCLIVKAWRTGKWDLDDTEVTQIERDHRNIRFIREHLTYDNTLALLQACDVYISLHRAEGLGLGILEAMSFGKPVIATRYSGPCDFLDEEGAVPVPYRLVPVGGEEEFYQPEATGAQAFWAQPDEDAAVAAMRRLREDGEYYVHISRGARALYARRQAEFLSLKWLEAVGA